MHQQRQIKNGHAKKKNDRIWENLCALPFGVRVIILLIISLFFRFLILNFIFPLNVDIKYSTIVTASDSTVLHAYLTKDEKWRMKTELFEITPRLKNSIIFKEDKYFYWHPGINIPSIVRAFFNNVTTGKRTSGASTITMQVVRMLNPKPRTYLNKIEEMFRALQLEFSYSKDEILQLYLNLVPYGGNIEGVKAASILYFGRNPDHLSIAEVTTLAIIPNRPTSLRLGRNNKIIKDERDKWLRRFGEANLFEKSDINDALEEPLNVTRSNAPSSAPHFSRRIKQRYPEQAIIYSTIDFEIQKKAEALAKEYIIGLYHRNIKNAAILIIDNHTREIIAYVGSADFDNNEDGGEVDGIKAIRSPGSTLKPILYGFAIDKGLICPKTTITDVPVNYSGYEPQNYDGDYHGKVSIEYALANSLNVPAVKTLESLGCDEFISELTNAGFKQIKKDRDKLGLSVILGGCGATLEELTTLYTCLADTGAFGGVRWTINQKLPKKKKLLSTGAAYMITEILTGLTRPDLPLQWFNSENLPKVAWKTGTSYGRKDAWSIGYNRNYTIGVWVGNFSGEGVPDMNGAETAAPLLFKVFNAIDYSKEKNWYFMPSELEMRYVCSESGDVPSEFCKNQVMDYFIPLVSSAKKCAHMKYVWVSTDSSISYCSSCLPELGFVKALYTNISPELVSYYDDRMIAYDKIPHHNPDCERVFTDANPLITSPVDGTDYYVNKEDSMQVMLRCNAANDVDNVFWYIDGKFLSKAEVTGKVFFSPHEGLVKIACVDDKGRRADIQITVKEIDF